MVFFDPRGGTHHDGRWKAPDLPGDALDALVRDNARRWVPARAWEAL